MEKHRDFYKDNPFMIAVLEQNMVSKKDLSISYRPYFCVKWPEVTKLIKLRRV